MIELTDRTKKFLDVLKGESDLFEMKLRLRDLSQEIYEKYSGGRPQPKSLEEEKEVRVASLYRAYIGRPPTNPLLVTFDMWKDLFVEGCQVLEERGGRGL